MKHYWTNVKLPEQLYYDDPSGGPGRFVNASASLWRMGNV
jgi:hypothetical protein